MAGAQHALGQQQESKGLHIALGLLAAIFATIFCSLATSASADSGPERYLSIDVHSGRYADYSADPRGDDWASVSGDLIVDVIRDEDPEAPDLALRLTDIGSALQTPVPLASGSSPSPMIRYTPLEMATAIPTETTPTATATMSPSPTLARWITPTKTRTPIFTLTPSNTPTATRTPTRTATPTPSNTPTSLPTSTPNACANITMSGFTFGASDARTRINNNTASAITVIRINFSWPSINGPLDEIKLDGRKIWAGLVSTPASISSGWTAESRTILAYDSVELKLRYDKSEIETGHAVTVFFSNGCAAGASN